MHPDFDGQVAYGARLLAALKFDLYANGSPRLP